MSAVVWIDASPANSFAALRLPVTRTMSVIAVCRAVMHRQVLHASPVEAGVPPSVGGGV
jgi:hypothetical protein